VTEIDRRGSLCGGRGGNFFAVFDIIARYYVKNKIALSLLLMTTRNHVWSNNADIANDLE